MIEQEQEQKESRPIRRIIRWLGAGIFAILFILAVIFQTPWKVIALLGIFLAACTVLPRPARKWFWLSVGAGVLALIIWFLVPADSKGWRPYTFDAESAALEAKYAVPDEENAALVYDEIFKTLDTDSNQPDFYMQSTPSSRNEPWLSKDHPEMAEWLKDRQDTIAKLLQAAKKDKCHYPISPHIWDFGRRTERLAPMRKSAFLLSSAGNNDLGEGRIDAGLEKYLCIIRMADHLYQQPAALDFLVGSALESVALTQLNRFVIEGRPTAEQLQLISASIRDVKDEWGSEFQKWLELDKLFTKNSFCLLVYEVNPQGKIRFNRNPFDTILKYAAPDEMPRLSYWQRLVFRTNTVLGWLFIPSTPQQASEILDAYFDKYSDMTRPDFEWGQKPQDFDSLITKGNFNRMKLNFSYFARFVVELSKGSYFGLHDAYLRSLAVRRGSRVLMAIKQYHTDHGTWPDSLDGIKADVPAEALIDPQNNGSFVYQLSGDTFTFYSKGKNGIDNQGRWSTTFEGDVSLPKEVEDDILFWPPRKPKAAEENADPNLTKMD